MRKLILQMQMSIDGRVSSEPPQRDWQVWGWGPNWAWDEALKREFNAIMARVDCILLSRKMAEDGYLEHWGEAALRFPAEPDWAFAQRVVDAHKLVFSRRLKQSRWPRSRVARGELAAELAALKQQTGGDVIAFGGVGFASALAASGQVDEFQFFINPAVLGAGGSIFGAAADAGLQLQLTGSQAYACGIVVNRYAPIGPAAARR
jgi:dihydrofolate reductase